MSADLTPQIVVMRDGRSAGFGFVDFKDADHAKTAIEEMNNSEYVHISLIALDLSRRLSQRILRAIYLRNLRQT